MKVLFVQKEPLLATALKLTLRGQGYEVVFCKNAVQAINLIKTGEPDLLIADFTSSKNELEMVYDAKSKKIPVIVLSKVGYEEQLQDAFDMDIDDYVSLPLSLPELSLRINKINRSKIAS